METAAPDMVRLVRQTGFHPDCSIAALAMLCGVMYEDALAAFADPVDVLLNGAGSSWKRMQRAARVLGVETVIRRRFDMQEDTGVLHVERKRPLSAHVCFLWGGRIVDGNGELWADPADYLRHYRYTQKSLLARAECG